MKFNCICETDNNCRIADLDNLFHASSDGINQRLGHFFPLQGSWFWLPKLPCCLPWEAAGFAALLLLLPWEWALVVGEQAGSRPAAKVFPASKPPQIKLQVIFFFFISQFSFQFTQQYWCCTEHCPRIGGTPHPGAGSSRSCNNTLLCSSFYWHLPFTLPKQGAWVQTCSWARLCHEEVLLWCVLYTGRGISILLELNPPQREWDPLSGSKGQAEDQERRCLIPPVHSPSALSCPFPMFYQNKYFLKLF